MHLGSSSDDSVPAGNVSSGRSVGQATATDGPDPAEVAAELRRDGFRVGAWRVEPRRCRLQGGGVDKTLEPRLVELLVWLAARSGEVISRDELLEIVWQGAYVSENTVSQAVSRLRKSLGDDRNDPQYLETIPKFGYRLMRPAERLERPRPEPSPRPSHVPGTVPGSRGTSKRSAMAWTAAVALGLLAAGWAVRRGAPEGPLRIVELRPESTLLGNQFEPRLSPDGDRLAFAWAGPDGDGFDIWLQPIGGDGPIRLTDHPDLERLPTWSPDGESIAFVRASQTGEDCGFFRIPTVGGRAERITDCFTGMRSLDWSPQGSHLVASAHVDSGPNALHLIDIATGQARQLTNPGGELGDGDRSPRFSPDGRQIAFSRVVSRARHDVMVIASSGGQSRPLTQDVWGQLRGVEWAPDGKTIFFSSNRDGRYSLWRVPLEGGELARVPIHDEWVTQPSLAGRRLIYRTFRDSVDLWELPLGAGSAAPPTQLLASTRSERQASWSPDGTRVAFLSDRSGTLEVWTGLASGDALLRHTDFSGPRPGAPAWSPDGDRLVFDAAVEGHNDLWSVALDSRRPERLIDDPSEDRNPVFSADGSRLYFASDRSGDWEIWQMPASGGPPLRVTRGGGFFARESPGGDLLFFSRLGDPGVWRQGVGADPAERPQLVLPGLDLADWGTWVVDERGIYFATRRPSTISFLGFDDEEPRVLFSTPGTVPYLEPSLSLSPGGHSLLFSMIGESDDELIRVELEGL